MSRIEKAALWAVLVTLFVISIHVQPMDRAQAKRAAVSAQIQAYLTALENYKLETGDYPSTSQGLNALRTNPALQAGTALTSTKTSDPTHGGTHTSIGIGQEQFRKLCRSEETAC